MHAHTHTYTNTNEINIHSQCDALWKVNEKWVQANKGKNYSKIMLILAKDRDQTIERTTMKQKKKCILQ